MRHGFVCVLLLLSGASVQAADTDKKPPEPVELAGRAESFYFNRNWNFYYWREDFSFLLKDETSGKTWRIISREPTPAYDWRMGTTFTDLKVDMKASPRVKVVGVSGVDRQPREFYGFKLDEPLIATAFVVYVDTGKDMWKEYFVNNWFHGWGKTADQAIHKLYADKKAPYDIYGFIKGQSAPFSKKSQELIAQHTGAKMFHGLIRSTKDNDFGYEIELINLVGPDKGGNGVVFYGDPKALVPLDKKKP